MTEYVNVPITEEARHHLHIMKHKLKERTLSDTINRLYVLLEGGGLK